MRFNLCGDTDCLCGVSVTHRMLTYDRILQTFTEVWSADFGNEISPTGTETLTCICARASQPAPFGDTTVGYVWVFSDGGGRGKRYNFNTGLLENFTIGDAVAGGWNVLRGATLATSDLDPMIGGSFGGRRYDHEGVLVSTVSNIPVGHAGYGFGYGNAANVYGGLRDTHTLEGFDNSDTQVWTLDPTTAGTCEDIEVVDGTLVAVYSGISSPNVVQLSQFPPTVNATMVVLGGGNVNGVANSQSPTVSNKAYGGARTGSPLRSVEAYSSIALPVLNWQFDTGGDIFTVESQNIFSEMKAVFVGGRRVGSKSVWALDPGTGAELASFDHGADVHAMCVSLHEIDFANSLAYVLIAGDRVTG